MAAPTNVSAATATDLGSFPVSTSQTVDDAGTTYTVWYKFTADATGVVSLFGYGDASVYRPSTKVFLGPASSPVAYITANGTPNTPFYFPVTGGVTYYLRFTSNSGNPSPAVLSISGAVAPTGALAAGMLAINDDVAGFPLAIVEAASGDANTIAYIQDIAAGESVGVLDDGGMALADTVNTQIVTYDVDFVQQGTVDTVTANPKITSDRDATFWTTDRAAGAGTVNWFVKSFSLDGTILDTTSTIGTTSGDAGMPNAIGVNLAGTILYWSLNAGITCVIHRWDLVNDVALSNLVTTSTLLRDIVVLADGSVVVADLVNDLIKQYSAAGALVTSFAAVSRSGDRLTRGATDATVWLWNKISIGNGQQTFTEFLIADGSTVTAINGYLYSSGVSLSSNLTPPLTNSQAFANSESCPFWILPTAFDVCVAPGIDVQPVDVTIAPADVVNLTVEASGTAPLSYQWYIGESGDTSNPIVGATSSTYTTNEIVATTTFWVRVTNECSLADAESVTVTVTVEMPTPAGVSTMIDPIRWVRRTPTIFSDGKRVFHRRLQIDMQVGVGLSVAADAHDHDPIILQRQSDDNGMTWSSFREMTMGAQGNYLKIARLFQLGAAYNRVYELSGDSPVKFCLVQAFLDIEGGDH